jgi:hypothetical protein
MAGRRVLAEELARRIHLPLGHEVEVWLYGGIRLRGKLSVKEEMLLIEEERVRHLELMVDHEASCFGLRPSDFFRISVLRPSDLGCGITSPP